MFKNAIEKINKFYNIDTSDNAPAQKVFEILEEIINFDSAGIFYLSPETLTLEAGKNINCSKSIKINKNLSSEIYTNSKNIPQEQIKKLLNINSEILINKLSIKDATYGLLIIERETEFTQDEKIIYNTCTAIISNLIKDIELSKVLKMQVEALQNGIQETNKAYETIKKQNKKIKQNEKLQNEFIANISHDLRTPLNSIIGFSEILSQKIFGDLNKKQLEYIEDIRISGLKLLAMINEILDITKIESRTIKLNISNVNINILINEVCNILKPLFEKKNIHLTKNINTEIELAADYIKLQQVLFNIVGNAIKFSPQNSEIKISAKQTDKNVIIKIKDSGIGIEKKYHKKIFNKFFQIQNTMTKTETSTGLGLTISKEFIKLHNGKITIDSEPNKGCEFTIFLKI